MSDQTTSEAIDTEFTEVDNAMATPAPATGTALATADNPYLAMAEMAISRGAVDQLDKLLDLQMKWDAEQQRKAFVAAMSSFKQEAGGITIRKSKHVSFATSKGKTEYDHAELHDITRVLVPMLAKQGLSHSWDVKQGNGAITVECVMSHRDGHSERVSMTAPADDSGGKNRIQAIASAKTYLERYTLLAATGIATGGELDDDALSAGGNAESRSAYVDALSDWRDAFADAQTIDELEAHRPEVRKLEGPLRKNAIALFQKRMQELAA